MTTKALNDLPLTKLISEPLHAAAESHRELSDVNLKILEELTGAGNKDFSFKREVPKEGGGTEEKTISVSVPSLALVDLPYFSIDSLVNEFTFEVSSIQDTLDEKSGSLSGSASAGGLVSKFVDFNLEAGYNKTNRTTTSNSERGKLNIKVTATKSGPSKGMQTIIDAAIKAITAKEV